MRCGVKVLGVKDWSGLWVWATSASGSKGGRNTMRLFRAILLILLLAGGFAPFAYTQTWQSFGVCRDGSEPELRENIGLHSRHIEMMDQKFSDIYYGKAPSYRQRPLRSDLQAASLNDIREYMRILSQRPGRRPAVLYYAHDSQTNKLCSWLILPNRISSYTKKVSEDTIRSLQAKLMNALDVTIRAREYSVQPRCRALSVPSAGLTGSEREQLLKKASELLFPPALNSDLLQNINTLIIVPIFSIGAIPFGALRIDNRPVVDALSVVIAPGFYVFKDPLRTTSTRFANPIIAGLGNYPEDPVFNLRPLPVAETEAKEVAALFGVCPFIGLDASKRKIEGKLREERNTGLIYLSTHGIADHENPLDGGCIWLSDGRWCAREIHNLPLRESQPLVVLSACQTGLGKTFEVGTIGMARSWHRAGASNVVMSLWRIQALPTMQLMTRFMELAKEKPTDRALQTAMGECQKQGLDPALWAGFSILGLPDEGLMVQP